MNYTELQKIVEAKRAETGKTISEILSEIVKNFKLENIKQEFLSRFGDKYDLHCGISPEGYIITVDNIINPTLNLYMEILLGLSNKTITTTKLCSDLNSKRYFNSLALLSMIKRAVKPSIIEEFESSAEIATIRKTLEKEF